MGRRGKEAGGRQRAEKKRHAGMCAEGNSVGLHSVLRSVSRGREEMMGKLAFTVCLLIALAGLVIVGVQLISMVTVGAGHGLRNIADFADALSVDPTASWALTWLIAGVVGLIVLAIARRPVAKAAEEQEAPAAEEGES